ncbi:MAG: DUF4296 domain-containing protein [Flavobacteriaceae bacterium]|nr:DUF4296 domain-containing protein [Flavobacteriaceae bacterium]
MRTISMILGTFILVLSCTSNTIYKKPEDLISEDSMVVLLRDLYLATSAKNFKNKNLQRKFSYIPLVYEKHKIDSNRFQRSNLYYTSKIDLYEPMLKKVLASLEKDRSLYAKQKKIKDSTRRDSLKKVRIKNRKKNTNNVVPEEKMIKEFKVVKKSNQ